MRIISGLAGGIPLQIPKGEVRPTTDRVREALFSILGSRVDDAVGRVQRSWWMQHVPPVR
jgi:16S rRNA (guanine966-N2)-methyltransferase